jgi:N-acetylglucosamine repressor
MSPQKATRQDTKEHNRDIVLKAFFDHDSISRAEIARITGLTRATISSIVSSFLDEGLVKRVGRGESIGGKAPVLLSLIADARYSIGINLKQDKFVGAIINLRGEIKEEIAFSLGENDGQDAIELIYQILDHLFTKDWIPVVGVGVAAPGLINTKEGVVISAVNLAWQDLHLAQLIRQRYDLPVAILNDSQAAAIGEYVYGREHKPNRNLIVVSVRHGIGAGILIDGKLFQGDGGGAGEIGHVVVQKDGLPCRCGKQGCLETIASSRAIVNRARELAPTAQNSTLPKDSDAITFEILVDAFFDADPLAQDIVCEAGRYLGASVANLISILNIHNIILTGSMTAFGEYWLQSIQDATSQAAFTSMALDTEIRIGKPELRSPILGASASMLLNNYSLLFLKTDS